MAPKRKSIAETTAIGEGEVGSASIVDDDGLAGEGEASTTATTTALPSKPISFMTKQQKDAASGADGIDQYELARTQVTKVAKSAIPENMQLRKEVILGLIKASTVFISYLSASALDKTHEAGNKTLSATHVINAFKEMGFPEEYATQLRREYNDKVKAEADRAKASKAAKVDAARTEEQGMDVDVNLPLVEEGSAAVEKGGMMNDESLAVDLSKDGAEEEMEEDDDEGDDGAEEDEDGDDNDEEDEEVLVEGDLGGHQEQDPIKEQAPTEQLHTSAQPNIGPPESIHNL